MREQIDEMHRHASAILERIRTRLRDGDRDAASRSVAQLATVLDAHFEQEDSLYHSAIAALRPERRASLAALAHAHGELRARCAGVARCLQDGALAESRREFERFVADFRSHEAEEERLLRSLDAPTGG